MTTAPWIDVPGEVLDIEVSNVGAETLVQLIDDVRRLVTTDNHQPLPTLLGDLVDTQERAFGLLEGRRAQSRAGICTRSPGSPAD